MTKRLCSNESKLKRRYSTSNKINIISTAVHGRNQASKRAIPSAARRNFRKGAHSPDFKNELFRRAFSPTKRLSILTACTTAAQRKVLHLIPSRCSVLSYLHKIIYLNILLCPLLQLDLRKDSLLLI